MTKAELLELLTDVPDDMKIMVMVEGGGETVFLILPHGSGVPEDEFDNKENKSPQLN